MEDVAGSDAESELEQRDGDTELDRDDRGDEDDPSENCGKLNCAHTGLLLRVELDVR
jgi:hypothetical protein